MSTIPLTHILFVSTALFFIGMYGLFTIVEAARQLAGEAGERQVKNAKLAIAQGNGGELSHEALLIFGTEETL